jgi:sugar O-acyltransferase (sialic acid O-acetyltransferase NeuD family)
MKNVVIVGAGGLGRQVLAQLQSDSAHGRDWRIQGFIDERGASVVPAELDCPWLGDPHHLQPDASQVFVVAIGDPASREAQLAPLLARGAVFMGVHTRTLLGSRTQVGASFLGLEVSSGVDTRIGDYCYIDHQTLLGHDVLVEDYVHMAPRCLLAGHVTVGKGAVLNSGAMIARGLTIGAGAVVGMGAVVFHDVPAGATVVGNPARIIFRKDN